METEVSGNLGCKLGTKAETLKILYGSLHSALVLPQYVFTAADFREKREKVIEGFLKLDWNRKVIVRSSAADEDTAESSQAGKYESVADVEGKEAFEEAVNRVLRSYGEAAPHSQVLVQPMLEKVYMCGVAFTLEPSTLGNYYVINYDLSGSTSSVTSGYGTENRLCYRFKGYKEKKKNADKDAEEMERLCGALLELENFFGKDNLDVEFAFTEDGSLYILQVRPLCVGEGKISADVQKRELKRIAQKMESNHTANPFLSGKRTIYSVMTDWNPAEMIGIRPKPLALSLYKEIITDNIWAYQRDNYGYKNLRSFPLMMDFGGLPYIDVRVSFNSFIPAELEEPLSEKLVNYYIDRLADNPAKHDKAEFEIVFSCYTLDLPERISVLSRYGFSEGEMEKIMDALRNVTNHIMDHQDGLWRKDYKKIEMLKERYDKINDSKMGKLEKIYWLLEDCKRYGTLPFAGLARAAFIAVQLMKSLVTCKILTASDYEAFMDDIHTVSSEMNHDFRMLPQTDFLKKYGHLRPGTYDITSPRYDEAPDLYFDWSSLSSVPEEEAGEDSFRLSLEQLGMLKQKLQEHKLSNDILELMDFIRTVIAGREYAKFVFTRNLSRVLQLIGEIGADAGIDREDCAYIDIQVLRNLFSTTKEIGGTLVKSVEQGKKEYSLTKSITLPPVILEAGDIWNFYYPESEPNYITSGKVRGESCVLKERPDVSGIAGKIVLIPSADPGFDWIFSHGIAGFITMYGGANSHMAIRAGELGIPAAVGVGMQKFETYCQAKTIELDALAKTIKILQG